MTSSSGIPNGIDGRGSSESHGTKPMRATSTRSCIHCRKRRRKCDRTLPSCLECQGLKRICQYKPAPVEGQVQADRVPKRQTMEPRSVAAMQTEPFPKVYRNVRPFLFGLRKFNTLQINVPVPQDVLQILTPDIISTTQAAYFQTLHPGLPIVSKRLLHGAISNTTTEPRADLALLLLCMKLITDVPIPNSTDGMRTPAYLAAKRLWRSIESAKLYSTRFLQAGLLICLYELGHAIYPEAHLSIAKNASLGLSLGINDSSSNRMNPSPASWTELEERTRTWWAVMILDRHVSVGIRGRPLATPEPTDHHVPVDDVAWEEDTPVPSEKLASPKFSSARLGMFAREAHASYLLGQVVKLKLEQTTKEFSLYDADQLNSTLQALLLVICQDIETSLGLLYAAGCPAVGLCNSALITLNMPSWLLNPAVPIPPNKKTRLLETLACKEAAHPVLQLAINFVTNIDLMDLNTLTPLIVDSAFQSAVVYSYLAKETGEQKYRDAVVILRKSLEFGDRRWKVSGAYLKMLDEQKSRW